MVSLHRQDRETVEKLLPKENLQGFRYSRKSRGVIRKMKGGGGN